MLALAFFASCAVFGLLGLCALALRDLPRIAGTAALIMTIAALGVAVLH